MAIFKKQDLRFELEQFKMRAHKLQSLLEGKQPNENIWDHYHVNQTQYLSEFVEIDIEPLEYAIEDFQTSLKKLKNLKNKSAKRLGKT